MRSIWQSLAWKEWHEHKWKLAAILGALWGTVAIALLYGGADAFGLAAGTMSFCIIPFAVFVGLGAAASERSRGTMAFLQALPAPTWPSALAKMIFGLGVLIASIVLTMPLYYGWGKWLEYFGDDRGALRRMGPTNLFSGNFYVDISLICMALAASLFIWSAAAGVNRKDEVSAGAVTLAVIVGWYILLFISGYLLLKFSQTFLGVGQAVSEPLESVFAVGLSTGAGGFLPASTIILSDIKGISDSTLFRSLLVVGITASLTHLVLIGWYLRRFGRITNVEVRSPRAAVRQQTQLDWLSAPRRSAFSAIVWKQLGESGPLVLVGMVGIIGMASGLFLFNWKHFLAYPGQLGNMLSVVSICLGSAITLIVGIGICFYDVAPQMNTFWRSRPIEPNMWFWCKFATGLAVLVCVLDLPILVTLAFIRLQATPPFSMFDATLMVFAAQMALFAAAVATTCLVRHAVYSAILSIPLTFLGMFVVWTAAKVGGWIGWTERPPVTLDDLSRGQFVGGYLITFVVCMVLGWLAVRFDWGRKSRY